MNSARSDHHKNRYTDSVEKTPTILPSSPLSPHPESAIRLESSRIELFWLRVAIPSVTNDFRHQSLVGLSPQTLDPPSAWLFAPRFSPSGAFIGSSLSPSQLANHLSTCSSILDTLFLSCPLLSFPPPPARSPRLDHRHSVLLASTDLPLGECTCLRV